MVSSMVRTNGIAFLLGCEKGAGRVPHEAVFGMSPSEGGEGDRIGVVGKNSDRKSTLLSLLAAGIIRPDEVV